MHNGHVIIAVREQAIARLHHELKFADAYYLDFLSILVSTSCRLTVVRRRGDDRSSITPSGWLDDSKRLSAQTWRRVSELNASLSIAGAALSGGAMGCIAGLRAGLVSLSNLIQVPWPLVSLAALGLITLWQAGATAAGVYASSALTTLLLQRAAFAPRRG